MRIVLAAIDGRDAASSVLDAARAMSAVFDATPRAVHVRDPGGPVGDPPRGSGRDMPVVTLTGDPVEEIVRAADHPDVVLVVVGARDVPSGPRPIGHIALGIVERTAKPVLVVPPRWDTVARGHGIERALVPLEGTTESTDAVTACMCRLAEAGVELVAVHVFDADVPRFWDEPAHATDAYTDEFSARWCRQPGVDVRLRRGSAPAMMMALAKAEDIDLIALAWAQDMAPGHAQMVRAALGDASVPILLVPVPRRSGPQDPSSETIRP